eukprot:3110136-Prymnesium_polylepis.1
MHSSSGWSRRPAQRWRKRRAIHASEFLPGGICASDQWQITAELRRRLSGCPMTSTGAERMLAIGRRHDEPLGDVRAKLLTG